MKPDKATDYFSAYYEGTLPLGLKSQFETLLSTNPSVADQYATFAAALLELDEARNIEIEPPADLHERIMRRVDRAAYEQKEQVRKGFFGQWRLALFGGAAAIAIVAGVVTLTRPDGKSDSTYEANTLGLSVPVRQTEARMEFLPRDGAPMVQVQSPVDDVIRVTVYPGNTVLAEQKISARGTLNFPITNSNPEGAVIGVRQLQGAASLWVALPGTGKVTLEGNGTLGEFIQHLANRQKSIVVLESKNPEEGLTWKFTGEAATAVETSLDPVAVEVKSTYIRVRH